MLSSRIPLSTELVRPVAPHEPRGASDLLPALIQRVAQNRRHRARLRHNRGQVRRLNAGARDNDLIRRIQRDLDVGLAHPRTHN